MLSTFPTRFWLLAVGTVVSLTAQTYIPQIADGGGWRTTIVLVNSNSSTASASLKFFKDSGSGSTQSWALPLLETDAPENISLTGGGTLFLHTPGKAADLSVGWAQVDAAFGVTAYAIFTQSTSHRDQDGTADATSGSGRVLVPFDNTSGYVTGAAFVNPTLVDETIAVGVQLSGTILQLPPITIPAGGHLAFALPQQFSATAGQKGMLEFYSASGSFAAIALRFNPTGAFTTAPVYEETGPPTIVSDGSTGGTGNNLPFGQNAVILIHPTFEPNSMFDQGGMSGEGGLLGITMIIDAVHNKFTGSVTGVGFDQDLNMSQFNATFTAPVSCTGNTCTFSALYSPASLFYTKSGLSQLLTSGSVTVIFTPQTASSGTVRGTVELHGTAAGWGSPFKGTYNTY